MSEQMTRPAAQPGPPDGRRPPGGPPEDDGRPDVPPTLRKLAAWSWRLLVVLTAEAGLYRQAGQAGEAAVRYRRAVALAGCLAARSERLLDLGNLPELPRPEP